MGERADELNYGTDYRTSQDADYANAAADVYPPPDYVAGGNAGEAAYYAMPTPSPARDMGALDDNATETRSGASADTSHDGQSEDQSEDQSPGQIRDNIQQTRQQMSHTIDAIQEKLSPEHLVNEAKHAVRDATIGRAEEVMNDVTDTVQNAGSSILDTIRENPIPSALAAVGLGWLIVKAIGNAQSNNDYSNYQGYGPGYSQGYSRGNGNRGAYYPTYQTGYGRYNATTNQNPVSRATNAVQDAAGNVTDKVQDVAGNVADSVQNAAGDVADTAQQLASQAQDQMQQFGYEAEWQMQRARNWLEQTWESNPLALGAAALAAGAIIGGLIPETSMEDRLMGDTRDTVLQKAESVAQDTVQKVEGAAQQALGTVKQNVTQSQSQSQSQGKSQGQTQAQPSKQNQASTASQTGQSKGQAQGSTKGASSSATSATPGSTSSSSSTRSQTPPPPTTETSSQTQTSAR